MDLHTALIEAVEEAGWSSTELAAAAGNSEAGARKWLSRQSTPGGDVLLVLMRKLPGFAARLGFSLLVAA